MYATVVVECESLFLNRGEGFSILARALFELPTHRKKLKNETVKTFWNHQNYCWPARWGDRAVGQRYGEIMPSYRFNLARRVQIWERPAIWRAVSAVFACRVAERHAFSAGLAYRSIERHAPSPGLARRSMERFNFQLGLHVVL